MDLEQFSLKDLYDVVLKSTYSMEVNGRIFQPGEVIARFDKIQISNFQEIKTSVAARGGFDNRARVYWDSTKEVQIAFTQGIFSKTQFALLSGAKVIYNAPSDKLEISQRDVVETDKDGILTLSKTPNGEVFFYDKNFGNKCVPIETISSIQYKFKDPFKDFVVDYTYLYEDKTSIAKIGRQLTQGFLSLEARTKIKFDETGNIKTGIIKIPKLKLMSDLSMKLGEQSEPVVGTFMASAIPTGERGNTEVMNIAFLNDDIDINR